MEQRLLRVAVLSRYALVRAGLSQLVHASAGRAVVVDTASHDGHLHGVDVVLYDLAGLNTQGNSEDLQHLLGSVPVVGLTRDNREDLTDGAITLGVRHTVPENVDLEELIEALEKAAGPARATAHDHDPRVLTQRERTVLALVAAGLTNGQIAAELFISINSVKTYIRTAYRKIGVTTRPQAVLWAIRNHLIPYPE